MTDAGPMSQRDKKDRKLISRKGAKHALSKVEAAAEVNISPLRILGDLDARKILVQRPQRPMFTGLLLHRTWS